MPARDALIEEMGLHSSGHAVRDASRLKLILVVDSKEFVENMASVDGSYTITALKEEAFTRAKEAAKGKAKSKKKRAKGKAKVEDSGAAAAAGTSASSDGIEGHVDWEDFEPTERSDKVVVVSQQTGNVVANSDGIVAVVRETALLNVLGVTIEYYLQPAKANLADGLAKKALE